MRAVIQRVSRASVTVAGEPVGTIGSGLVVLLGIAKSDTESDAIFMADKIAGLRIFEDPESGKMSDSVAEVGGAVLIVSQFTLYGDVRRGRRPSFDEAAPPQQAEPLYKRFCELLREKKLPVQTGVFRAMMQVESVNDGPVTILLDSDTAL